MNHKQASDKALELLESNASRSSVCSFINQLAAAKLITEQTADRFADTLTADRGNATPVLKSIQRELARMSP
jgi:hypothetical protein